MATGATLLNLTPLDFFSEGGATGQATAGEYSLVGVGLGKGISFPPGVTSGVIAIKRLPSTASMSTGLTFKLLLATDVLNAGAVSSSVVFGVNAGMGGASGAYYPIATTALGTENTGTIQLASTAGKTREGSIAIVTANVGGVLIADTWAIIRIRRLGANASDTLKGRVVLLGASVLDT